MKFIEIEKMKKKISLLRMNLLQPIDFIGFFPLKNYREGERESEHVI